LNIQKMAKCRTLARELLDRISEVQARYDTIASDGSEYPDVIFWGCKETAALKRTSMELTHSLTELRKPE
jgi:hypothetical protein